MGFLKKYSFRTLFERIGQGFMRFPLAMLFVIFLTGFILYLIHGGKPGSQMEFFLIFYPATAALLAVALSLLTEDFKNWRIGAALQVVAHAAWFAISYYLSQFDRFSLTQLIAVSATVFAISMSVFLVCFYRKHQEVPFWNFSIRTVAALFLAIAIGGALALGLLLLTESLKMLFGLHISNYVYADIWTVCMVLLAPSLFMALIPKGGNKYLNTVPDFSGFAKGVVQYLFIPLLLLYMVTLYAYGAKILLEWTLPVGGVSYLVSGSMALMVLLIYLTHPIQHQEGNKLFKRVTRCLPVAMLPLLALMTVAIGRRLSDYGITVSRLYLLVFNVWCYCVCLWLIFTRNKRIWLIPASFAIILFLISVGPQSIANITQRQLKNEVRNAFTASGLTQFPLSGDQYEKWLASVDSKTAAAIDSKLDYLQDFYRYGSIEDLIGKDAVVGRVDDTVDDLAGSYEHYSNWNMISRANVPDGYRQMTWVGNERDESTTIDGDKITVVIETEDGVERSFELSVKALIALDEEKWKDQKPDPLILDNGEALFFVNRYSLSINPDKTVDFLNIEGLLLTR